MISQAIILVGGKGSRLGSLTKSQAKPILPVCGTPFLDRILFQVAQYGVRHVLLLAGHGGEEVRALYDKKTISSAYIEVILEPEPLGTAGALAYCSDRLEESFLLMNGDSIFHINLFNFVEQHKGHDFALALRAYSDVSRYGQVIMNEQEQVVQFADKSGHGAGVINAGIYILNKSILNYVPKTGFCSMENEVFPSIVQERLLYGSEHDGFFLDIGVPESYQYAQNHLDVNLTAPALFLDRDGVLNVDSGYVSTKERFVWRKGVFEALTQALRLGYRIIVVTNQSGVARGYYTRQDVIDLHDWINDELRHHGSHICSFYYCPHHIEGTVAEYIRPCFWRKPEPGMLLKAFECWNIDKEKSFLLGDKQTDLNAAEAAGIQGFLVTNKPLIDDFITAHQGLQARRHCE